MKRIAKVLPRDPLIPELGFFVFTQDGAILWNGQIGIKYGLKYLGTRLSNLVTQHGSFAVLEGLQFLRVVSVLEKISGAFIEKEESVLRIEANDGKTRINIPITLDINPEIPHLQINWNATGVSTPIQNLWVDAQELVTAEGTALWGEVIGVYEAPTYNASFDYGILLYDEKEKKGKSKTINFCPKSLLDLGLQDIAEAHFTEDGVFLRGQDVQYFTSAISNSDILVQLLQLRTDTLKAEEKAVSLDFTSGLWKRAKVFNKLVLTMQIRNGIITLSGGNWTEVIGQTDAPDQNFITRISLLQRWTIGTLSHKIFITDDTWYLYGKTRKGTEFFGNLTTIPTNASLTFTDEVNDTSEDDGITTGIFL
jgi:hypothetical protein